MKVEELAVALRPRSDLEAMDLGLALARQGWREVWAAWLLVFLPVASVALAVGGPSAALAVWLLKPVLDLVPLHVLSRALFARRCPPTDALRQVLPPRNLPSLLVLRLDPRRLVALPVVHLEGLQGEARRRRLRRLAGADLGGVWVGLCGLLTELVVAAGAVALALTFLPDSPENGVEALFDRWWEGAATGALRHLPLASWLLAVLLVEPFSVAAGFGVYVSRRANQEGWDVELAFRKLAGRLKRV